MIKKETYTINEILDNVIPYNGQKHYVDYDGDLMKMESQRYRLFKRDGTTCVVCKSVGTFFRKEKDKNCPTYHFNLYGIIDGEDRLFTKDHLIPKSKGGKNVMANYCVMCTKCNHEKGNRID